MDHRCRRRLSDRWRESEAGYGNLLGVSEACHGDCAFKRHGDCTFDGIGVTPEPEVVEIEGRKFGPGIEDREGWGPVGGLVLGCGGYDVGWAVGESAVEGVVQCPGVEELGVWGRSQRL